jgi:hypothetical protein
VHRPGHAESWSPGCWGFEFQIPRVKRGRGQRLGALALVKSLRSPKRSGKRLPVGDGPLDMSGVRTPRLRLDNVSMRLRADDWDSCISVMRLVSYSRLVLVTLLPGVVVDCQSLPELAGWEMTEVAAVELRPRDGVEDVVELVSRLRL